MKIKKILLLLYALHIFCFGFCVATPKISIITSVYKGDQFIRGFLEDIVQQTVFDQCELIIVNANSPENEEPIILEFVEQYSNIFYYKLEEDPGLYGVWNFAIQKSSGDFITNANVDDRLAKNCYEKHMQALECNLDIDLVYSDYLITHVANETFCNNSSYYVSNRALFSPDKICDCLPGCNPMWRKSMHEKYGFFDEQFQVAGDWEMWCRAVSRGAIFLKVPGVYVLYFLNPQGLSASDQNFSTHAQERQIIQKYYGYLWN